MRTKNFWNSIGIGLGSLALMTLVACNTNSETSLSDAQASGLWEFLRPYIGQTNE